MSAGDAGTCTRAPPEGAGSSQTRIVDLSGDLLAYIYSTYLAELVVPHLAVCQRFRSVLLGVECVEFRVEVVRARGLPLAASALQRFRGDVRLVLYTSDDDDALVAARCWHELTPVLDAAGLMGLEIMHEGAGFCSPDPTAPLHTHSVTSALSCLCQLAAGCIAPRRAAASRGSLRTLKIANMHLGADGAAMMREAIQERVAQAAQQPITLQSLQICSGALGLGGAGHTASTFLLLCGCLRTIQLPVRVCACVCV